jgi:hypothetical protein
VFEVAFNPTVIDTGATFVEIPPTSNVSEIPAIIPPFASAGTVSVMLVALGAAVERGPACGRELAVLPPPPPQPENKRELAAIISTRRTLVP